MKKAPANNKGLSKLPKEVRNKMGYKATGGKATKAKMTMGGKVAKAPQKKMYGGKAKKK